MADYQKKLRKIIQRIKREGLAPVIFTGSIISATVLFTGLGKELPFLHQLQYLWLIPTLISGFILARRYWKKPDTVGKEMGRQRAIKGLSPFIELEDEASLFKALGRSPNVDSLFQQVADSENPLVVLCGQPGSGKTSLLRAGLIYELKKLPDTEVCYWQARPDSTIDKLIEAIVDSFHGFLPPELGPPVRSGQSDEAQSKASDSTNKLRIVVLDHFDFLRPEHELHKPFFEVLQGVSNAVPPYHCKYVIAFREEYSSIWRDVQKMPTANPNVIELGLPPLHSSKVQQIIGTLLERAAVDVDAATVERYVSCIANGPEVRPISIGIGTEVFDHWVQNNIWSSVRQRQYLRAGGTKGVFADHVQYHLKAVAPDHYTALLNELCNALIDKTGRNREMEGVAAKDFQDNDIVGMPTYLRSLAATNRRILERVDSRPEEERYRLAQDEFAEVLLALSGRLKAESHYRLDWSIEEQFECWRQKPKFKYLLRSEQFRGLSDTKGWSNGPNPSERRTYVRKSRWRYVLLCALRLLGVLCLAVCLYSSYQMFRAHRYGQMLEDWQLPPELYTKQTNLDAISIDSSSLKHLQWLKSNQLTELEINSPVLKSLDGIGNAPNVQILILNLKQSQIKDLSLLGRLHHLNNLTLFMGGTHDIKLTGLTALGQLHTLRLSLDNSNSDVSALGNPPQLETLVLDLQTSLGQNLASITQFTNVKELSVNLRDSQIRELPDFPPMNQLTALNLNLEHSSIVRLGSLNSLHSLKSLSISVKDSTDINVLPDLSSLTELECLDLNLEGSTVTQLPLGLNRLHRLKTLSLRLARSAVKQIPDLTNLAQLQNLTLDLKSTHINGLPAFGPNRSFESLTLNLQSLSGSDLQKLSDLAFLHRLDLDMSIPSDAALPALRSISGLRDVTIHVSWPQLTHLPELPELTHLTLYAGGALPANVSSEAAASLLEPLIQLPTLTALTLYLDDSPINLPHFGETNHLNALVLHLQRTQVKALNNLAELKQLNTLTLDVEGSSSLEALPGLEAMTHLHDLSLKLRGTSIKDLSALRRMTEMANLELEIGDSKIKTLPELNFPSMQKVSVDVEGALSAISLGEVSKLFVRDLTVNSTIPSLAELPTSVSKLNLGRIVPMEDSGQTECKKQKPPFPQ